ncbi:blue light receptor [Phlyctochytrium planicorne]|nr:blue light receptor [Phlyctochytrium planicorne]
MTLPLPHSDHQQDHHHHLSQPHSASSPPFPYNSSSTNNNTTNSLNNSNNISGGSLPQMSLSTTSASHYQQRSFNHPSSLHPSSFSDGIIGVNPSVGLSGIYSQSGFDLLSILARVVNRPNPVIAMGNVDFSCAFTVTDPRLPGNPIIYASETFSRLTGYSNSEILGKNCRFLQSPTGVVEAGSTRKYSDSNVAFQMKESIKNCKECQFSIINYKKSGEPFINLVTIIPLNYEGTNEIEYFLGFQVDLVEQPQAILSRCKEGSYMVDYKIAEELSRRESSRASPNSIDSSPFSLDSYSQTMSDHFISKFLETSDFIHILSLRARFLYASPVAAKRILEYSSGAELLGRELHEFVHPADLVSVMRELRTSRPGDNINFICRFKRKFSGYIYLEVNGHIYEGSNVNKKCFVFSGRELNVSILPGVPLASESIEIWFKVSTEGLILYSTGNSDAILGYNSTELFGFSIFDILHADDRPTAMKLLKHVSEATTLGQIACRVVGKTALPMPAHLQMFPDKGSIMNEATQPTYDPMTGTLIPSRNPSTKFIFCRMKLVAHGTPLTNIPVNFGFNLFDVMNETRATSLHYELNQLRILNKRLREELLTMESVNPASIVGGNSSGRR